jgi:hypothetical protein
MFSCNCEDQTRYASLSACRRQAEEGFARLQGEVRGLTYDPRCYGSMLEAIAELGCSPPPGSSDECDAPCSPYHGERSEGAACEPGYAGSSECARGLSCIANVCTDPCGIGSRGEPCGARGCAEGLWCDFGDSPPSCKEVAAAGESCMGRPCDDASWCDFTDNRCRPLPGEGEACGPSGCREGTFCDTFDPEPTCRALGDAGDPCRGHAQCNTGYCPAGFCAPIPREGESCAGTSACAEGLMCREDVCVPRRPAVCNASLPWPDVD